MVVAHRPYGSVANNLSGLTYPVITNTVVRNLAGS